MQCVILAAGLGTRMGDLTENCPKPMLLIHGKPKLAYTIEMLPQEISEVIIVVGYLQEQIREYFGENYEGRKITYVEQDVFNGTAGAIELVKDIVGDRFLVLMGDDLYYQKDLVKLLKYNFGLLAYKTHEASQFGLIEQDNEGFLKDVIERPHDHLEGLVNIGAYILSREYFDVPMVAISETEYGLPQTLVTLGKVQDVHVIEAGKWQSIGNPQDLKIAEEVIIDYINN